MVKRLGRPRHNERMLKASILETKTRLSELVRLVEAGERVTITRGGKAVAELVPSRAAMVPFDVDHGKIRIGDDFKAPLPADLGTAFGIR